MKTRATWEQFRARLDIQPTLLERSLRDAARAIMLQDWLTHEGLGSSDISCKMYDLMAYHCADGEEFFNRMFEILDCHKNKKLYLL